MNKRYDILQSISQGKDGALSEENEDLADTEKASSELLTGKNPKTGDSFTAVVSILYLIISGVMIAVIVYKKKHKKET